MQTENDTQQPVDYDQNGNDPPIARSPCSGLLPPGASHTFPPCGQPPWVVTFTLPGGRKASSRPLLAHEAGATVTLQPGGTVVVS